jgi:hypothetical protein
MRTQKILILIVLTSIALLFFVGPGAAKSKKIAFQGERTRIQKGYESEEVKGCMLLQYGSWAEWDVYNCHELVDGWWYNYDTNAILMATGCPDEWNPAEPNYQAGTIQGSFMLFAGGGFWEGYWKQIRSIDQDGNLLIRLTATADGYGGDIEGLKLIINTFPAGGKTGAPFNGYIITPQPPTVVFGNNY